MYKVSSIVQKFKIVKSDYNKFFLGITIYSVGVIARCILVNARALLLVSLAGIIISLWYGGKLIKLNGKSRYFGMMLVCLFGWQCFVILNGISFRYEDVKNYLFTGHYFWPFLVPLVSLFSMSEALFSRVFAWVYYYALVFLISLPLTLGIMKNNTLFAEQTILAFVTGCGLILLTWSYHTYKRKIVSSAAILIALICVIIIARRNVILTLCDFLLFAFFLYFFYYAKANLVLKLFPVLAGTFVCIVIGTYFYLDNKNSMYDKFRGHLREDTRKNIFYLYFKDMRDDWIIGKGINGTYYCPMKDESTDTIIKYRGEIECGYLQIILKGGIVNLVIYLLLLLPSAYLGIFRSKNGLSKGLGIIIFLWVIDMFPFGVPVFGIRYILVWIAVGAGYSKKLRNTQENAMRQMLRVW